MRWEATDKPMGGWSWRNSGEPGDEEVKTGFAITLVAGLIIALGCLLFCLLEQVEKKIRFLWGHPKKPKTGKWRTVKTLIVLSTGVSLGFLTFHFMQNGLPGLPMSPGGYTTYKQVWCKNTECSVRSSQQVANRDVFSNNYLCSTCGNRGAYDSSNEDGQWVGVPGFRWFAARWKPKGGVEGELGLTLEGVITSVLVSLLVVGISCWTVAYCIVFERWTWVREFKKGLKGE
jgi:hypothetical protein